MAEINERINGSPKDAVVSKIEQASNTRAPQLKQERTGTLSEEKGQAEEEPESLSEEKTQKHKAHIRRKLFPPLTKEQRDQREAEYQISRIKSEFIVMGDVQQGQETEVVSPPTTEQQQGENTKTSRELPIVPDSKE